MNSEFISWAEAEASRLWNDYKNGDPDAAKLLRFGNRVWCAARGVPVDLDARPERVAGGRCQPVYSNPDQDFGRPSGA